MQAPTPEGTPSGGFPAGWAWPETCDNLRAAVTGMGNGCRLGIREAEVFDTLPSPDR